MEAQLSGGYTPLLIAIIRGYCPIIEKLVGFGANLNAKDDGGNTALHLLLNKTFSVIDCQKTPELFKVIINVTN